MRLALDAIGKMYANKGRFAMPAGQEVVQYPCQQNFTFITTDGYWNGGAPSVATTTTSRIRTASAPAPRAASIPAARARLAGRRRAVLVQRRLHHDLVAALQPRGLEQAEGLVPAATAATTSACT
jgi:hypothetical protein